MPTTTPAPWSELLASPFGLGLAVYLLIGFAVVFYVTWRYSWLRRRPDDAVPWPRRENPQQGLNLFLMAGTFHPVVFLIQVALWPLWLFFLWACEPDDEEEESS